MVSRRFNIIISICCFLFSVFCIYIYFNSNKNISNVSFTKSNITNYLNNTKMLILDEINLLINKSEEINVESDTSDSSSILMTINIPKINVNNNIYSFGSYENNIDKNVIIMNESNMPDVKNGNLIIGGHSGVGDIAYFKDFDKLDKGDKVIIRYKNKKYEYIIDKFYKDYKDGSISIVRDLNRNTITLYTCMPNNKKYYLVVIGYLKDF